MYMCVCVYIYIYISIHYFIISISIYIYVSISLSLYIYIYIYIYLHIHANNYKQITQKELDELEAHLGPSAPATASLRCNNNTHIINCLFILVFVSCTYSRFYILHE